MSVMSIVSNDTDIETKGEDLVALARRHVGASKLGATKHGLYARSDAFQKQHDEIVQQHVQDLIAEHPALASKPTVLVEHYAMLDLLVANAFVSLFERGITSKNGESRRLVADFLRARRQLGALADRLGLATEPAEPDDDEVDEEPIEETADARMLAEVQADRTLQDLLEVINERR